MENNIENNNSEFENLKDNSSTWGGARPNAGRPKGSENEATKEKRIVEEQFKQRVLKASHQLINSQMNLAQGVQMLYCIEKDDDGKNKKPRLVESQGEIEAYLEGDYDEAKDYYFITTERPDNRALDSLFDRVFGKSVNNLDLKSDGKELKAITGFNYILPEETNGNTEDNNANDKTITQTTSSVD